MKKEDHAIHDQEQVSLIAESSFKSANHEIWLKSFYRKCTGSLYFRFVSVYGLIVIITLFTLVLPALTGPRWQVVGKFDNNSAGEVVITEFFELGSRTEITASIKTGILSSNLGGLISVLLVPEGGTPEINTTGSLHLKSQASFSSRSEPSLLTDYCPGRFRLYILTFDLENWEVGISTYI